jgi:general secretion pathway protein K
LAQTRWIERAAVDYARLVLNQDLRAGPIDHNGEIWATPVEDTRLDETVTAGAKIDSDKAGAFLRGQIFDAQGRLNLNNLVGGDGKLVGPEVDALAKLLTLLGKSSSLAALIAARIQRSVPNLASGQAPVLATALPFKRAQDLTLVPGVDQATVDAIAPFIIFLPDRNTAVNLNTASAEVLAARMPDLSISTARDFVDYRTRQCTQTKCISDLSEAATRLKVDPTVLNGPNRPKWDVKSSFFLLEGVIRYDRVESQTETLLFRRGQGRVEVQWQDRY